MIHTFKPKNPTITNNIIQIMNRNRISFFLQFHFKSIKNKNIKPQYNKKNRHQLSDIAPSCTASTHGKIFLRIKLKANKDQTNKKLVQNKFREIILCDFAKIC